MNFQAGPQYTNQLEESATHSVLDKPCSCVHAQTHKPNRTNGHRNDEADGHLGKVP